MIWSNYFPNPNFLLSHMCAIYLMDHLKGAVLDFKAIRSNCRRGSGMCKGNVIDCLLSLKKSCTLPNGVEIGVHLSSRFSKTTFPDLQRAWHEQGAKFSSYSFTLDCPLWTCPGLHVLKWKCACAKKRKKEEELFDFIQSMICTLCFLVVFSDYLNTQCICFR